MAEHGLTMRGMTEALESLAHAVKREETRAQVAEARAAEMEQGYRRVVRDRAADFTRMQAELDELRAARPVDAPEPAAPPKARASRPGVRKAAPRAWNGPARYMPAKFPGRCACCGEAIAVGERIAYAGRAMHVDCATGEPVADAQAS